MVILNCNNYTSQHYCFCVFDQRNAVLVSIRDVFQAHMAYTEIKI